MDNSKQARPFFLRTMTRQDLDHADALRAAAGWNQTREDWERILAISPDGCSVAEWGGEVIGTVTAIPYGSAVGWIGMLLVHPNQRSLGVGRALLNRAIEFLRTRVTCIKLDATPQGKPLYEKLGFVETARLNRWQASPVAVRPRGDVDGIRIYRTGDWEALLQLDAVVFGERRGELLSRLVAGAQDVVVCEIGGKLRGFGLLRPGRKAAYMGPVEAESPETARGIIEVLLSATKSTAVYWDILEGNRTAQTWATEFGFTVQRPLLRMLLGDDHQREDASRYYAILDPACG